MADNEIIADEAFEEELETEVWEEDISGPGIIARMVAEVAGAFILVFLGVGTALFLNVGQNGTLTVAFGFAIGVIIAAVIFGRVSGAHLNPAVTVGVWLAGRFPGRDVAPYVLSQVIGGLAAGGALFALASSNPQIANGREYLGFGANGFAEHSPAQFGLGAALAIEVILVAMLVGVVLAATAPSAPLGQAPWSIGLAFGFLILVAIPFTNGALNPARATGIALFSDAWAMEQLWVFWVAPVVGAAIAGLLYRAFAPEDDFVTVEVIEEIED